VPDPDTADWECRDKPRRPVTVFAKDYAFLTPGSCDATYTGRSFNRLIGRVRIRAESHTRSLGADKLPSVNPSRYHGSPLRQRILRVARDVHNNKELGL